MRRLVAPLAVTSFALFAVAAASGATPPRLEVGGLLLGHGGAPAAGRVELMALPGHHAARLAVLEGAAEPAPAVRAEVGGDGRFLLAAPAAGMWSAVASAPGRVAMRYLPLPVVGPVELPPVELPADAGVEVAVRWRDGRPAAGAWVTATSDSPELWRAVARDGWQADARHARSDAGGRARLPRLVGERLTVHAMADGARAATAVAGDAARAEVVLDPPAGRHVIELRDAQQRPVAGAAAAAGNPPWPVGVSGDDGRFDVPAAVAAGPLDVLLADGRRWRLEPPRPAAAPEGEPLRVALAPRPRLAGRVLDAATRRPLAGVLVWPGDDPGSVAFTDERGGYTVAARDGGRGWVQAEADGFAPRALRLPPAGEAGPLATLLLDAAGTLAGRAVDARGAPIPGVAITAAGRRVPYEVFDRDPAAARAVSDAAGRFVLRGLTAAPAWELTATRHGYHAARATVAAGGEAHLALAPARAAHGAVVDLDERPLAGVVVTVRPAAGAPGEPVTATTGDDGRFALAALPAERVDLEARRSGFAPRRVPGVAVPAGEGATDLGTLVLVPGATIAGGVADAAGRPLAGVEVWLAEVGRRPSPALAESLRREPPAASSDAAGRFAVADLAAGTRRHVLLARSGYLPAWVPGVAAPPAEPLAVVLAPASRIRGRVEDEEGRPVAAASVRLAPAPPPPGTVGVEPMRAENSAEVRSERDGGFVFDEVAPGAVLVEAQAEGFLHTEPVELRVPEGGEPADVRLVLDRGARLSGLVTSDGGEPVAGAVLRVAAARGASDAEGRYRIAGVPLGIQALLVAHPDYRMLTRELDVQPGENRVDVTVEEGAAVSGRVVDEEGAPHPGATVALRNRSERALRGYAAISGAGGRFEIAGVAEGRYDLEAEAEGFAPAVGGQPVTVGEENVDGIEVVLRAGATVSGRIRGLELDELAAVEVTAERDGRPERSGSVDYAGRYRVAHLEPGDWHLRARVAGGRREADAWVAIAPGQREVERDLELGSGLVIDGVVLLDGEPLPRAQVALRGLDVTVNRGVATDHRGAFRVEDLEPGHYRVEVVHPGRLLSQSRDLDLLTDSEVVIELATATLAGTVVAADTGEGVYEAMIYLQRLIDGEPGPLTTVATDAAGSFVTASLAPGPYRLTVRGDGYGVEERLVEALAGVPAERLRFELERTDGLTITVRLAAGGEPPRFTTVVVLGEAGRLVHFEEPVLSPFGVGYLQQIRPGTWTLLVKSAGAATAAVAATVPGPRLEVTLPPAAPLTVRVPALADSRAAAALSIAAAGGAPWSQVVPGGTLQSSWPLAGGTVTVPDLPAGAWQLQVTAVDGRAWAGEVATDGVSPAAVALD
jgi:hypothetical protein